MKTVSQRAQVVVVTGASAGVGRAVAREFGSRRARVGLIGRGIDGLQAAAKEIEDLGGQALVLPCDVADAAQVDLAASRVEETFGPIDVWVNNAMASVFSPVRQMLADEYRRVTDVTYLGTVYGTLAALKRMFARDRGMIVQVGSALAYRSIPLQSAYCAAKHAIVGFTDSLRSELIHDGSHVKLTVVHLPAVNTPQFGWARSRLPNEPQPVPPIFQPEVAARAIVWATEHHRREGWVGWPTMKAIVGQRLIPGLLDRYLAHVGYSAQQTDQPESPARADNLYAPIAGDHGAHGTFDRRARPRSLEWMASSRRVWLGAAALAVAALASLAAVQTTRARAHHRRWLPG